MKIVSSFQVSPLGDSATKFEFTRRSIREIEIVICRARQKALKKVNAFPLPKGSHNFSTSSKLLSRLCLSIHILRTLSILLSIALAVIDFGPCNLHADSISSSCILIVFIVLGLQHSKLCPLQVVQSVVRSPMLSLNCQASILAKSKSKRNQLSGHLSICLLSRCSTTAVEGSWWVRELEIGRASATVNMPKHKMLLMWRASCNENVDPHPRNWDRQQGGSSPTDRLIDPLSVWLGNRQSTWKTLADLSRGKVQKFVVACVNKLFV